MKIEFDAEKDAINREKHGLSLADAVRLNLGKASVVADQRRDYGEGRFQAYGRIDGRLHVLAFTVRPGGIIRVISFRKANAREEKRHGNKR